MTDLEAPAGLAVRGLAFWQATTVLFDLTDSEATLLAEACRMLDECDLLKAAIDRDGTTVAGAAGQTRVHPAIGELRQHRLAAGRLLGQLALPGPDDTPLTTPRQASAKKASVARWAAVNRAKLGAGQHGNA